MVVKTTLSLHVPSTHLLVSIHDIFFSGSVTIFYSYVLYLSHGTNENQSLRLFIHALETVCASEIFSHDSHYPNIDMVSNRVFASLFL